MTAPDLLARRGGPLVAACLVWLGACAAPGGPDSSSAVRGAEAAPAATDERAPAPGELAPGRFLIASRSLQGPFFAESVVLLLDYGPGGALGLVVNRPTHLELAELLPEVEALRDRADTVFVGGPVEGDRVMFLIRAREQPTEARRVIGDVYVSRSRETLDHVLEANTPPSRFHAYLGYAGWAPGQLDAELAGGHWYVAPAEPDAIFADAVSGLWPTLVREHEGLRVRRGGRLNPTARPSDASAGRTAECRACSESVGSVGSGWLRPQPWCVSSPRADARSAPTRLPRW